MGLRVVSYNVHSQRDDLDALASIVRSLAPDVLVVQEAPRRWRWRTKCAELAHSFGMFVAVGGQPSLGNLIVTNLRVRITDTWCMRFPLTPGRHMRGAAFARCTVAGAAPIVIAGSHLSTDDSERPAQASMVRQALHARLEPVVLGVDLNETPSGSSWQILSAGFTDSGIDGPATFPTRGADRRIDALFVDPRLTVNRFEVVTGPAAIRASDHFPLVADLTLPPP